MNENIIIKVNKGIMETKVDLTYKEFVSLLSEIKDKDKEIKEYKEYLIRKDGINFYQDEKLLKTKNILPSNVRYKKDSFVISRLEENTWYVSKYIDNEFKYTVIRLKDDEIKAKGCFRESENIKGLFDDKNKKYFIVTKSNKF
ncbi:hypothetical protein QYB59_000026 [Clostridium perfringens]|nr:hypothetical protein [Clostridium perfringens]